MPDSHKNFSYSTVATAPSPADTGTSLIVQAGDGALFPAVPFNASVWPAGVQPLASNAEIVRVTNISTDTFTITREQESTSARSILVGDQIAATVTVKTLTDAEAGGGGNGGFDVLYAQCIQDRPLETTYQTLPGDGDSNRVRLLLPKAGDHLVSVIVEFYVDATGGFGCLGGLFIDDAVDPENNSLVFQLTTAEQYLTSGQQWKVTTAGVNVPVELKVRKIGAGGTYSVLRYATNIAAITPA